MGNKRWVLFDDNGDAPFGKWIDADRLWEGFEIVRHLAAAHAEDEGNTCTLCGCYPHEDDCLIMRAERWVRWGLENG